MPDDDREQAAALQLRGWERGYVDLQMRRRLAGHWERELPAGHAAVALNGPRDAFLHREVHELICAAWSVPPHWEAFLGRFVRE